jgi:hypothetical protein
MRTRNATRAFIRGGGLVGFLTASAWAQSPEWQPLGPREPIPVDQLMADAGQRNAALYKTSWLMAYAGSRGDIGVQVYRFPARFGPSGKYLKGLLVDASIRFDNFDFGHPAGFDLTSWEAIAELPFATFHRLGIAGSAISLGGDFYAGSSNRGESVTGDADLDLEVAFRAGRVRAFYRFEHQYFSAEVGARMPVFWMVEYEMDKNPSLYEGMVPLSVYGGVGF